MIAGLKRIPHVNGEIIVVRGTMNSTTIIKDNWYVTLEDNKDYDYPVKTNYTFLLAEKVCVYEVDPTEADFNLDEIALKYVELIKESSGIDELRVKSESIMPMKGVTAYYEK